jgi:D-alanyl-D-alanine carboxypeptidase (penicillin-binding protein 5/6)
VARTPSPGTDEDAADATPKVPGGDHDTTGAAAEEGDGAPVDAAVDAPETTGPDADATVDQDETAPGGLLGQPPMGTSTADEGAARRGPRHARHRPRRRRWPYVATALVVLVVAGGVVQLLRPLPATTVSLRVPAHVAVAGPAPVLPWPAAGQGALAIPALGLLRSSAPEAPVPVASLTKMMTAYLVLRAHPLGAGDQGPSVTMSAADEALAHADRGAGDASVPVKAGEQLTERQLLDGLLVPSADNLADVLATWVSGSTPAFVAAMNTAAAGLGLHDTHYADASGLDPGSVSTAADQLRLAMVVMKLPAFAAVVDQPSTTLPLAGTVSTYIRSIGTDGIVGVKSGYTDAAKGCMVLAATRSVGGHQVLVFAAVTGQSGADPHAVAEAAARAVIDAAGSALVPVSVVPAGAALAVARAPWGDSAQLRAGGAVSVVAWPGDVVRMTLSRATATGATSVPAHGTVLVRDGAERLVVPVAATHTLPGPSLLWRLLHG